MSLKFISSNKTNDTVVTLVFEGNADELAKNINDFFVARKYKLKQGTLDNAVYERGNYVMRILFGAFVAYYKFNVIIKKDENNKVIVNFLKAHSGIAGGLIGIAKLKKEFNLMAEGLEKADSPLGVFATA